MSTTVGGIPIRMAVSGGSPLIFEGMLEGKTLSIDLDEESADNMLYQFRANLLKGFTLGLVRPEARRAMPQIPGWEPGDPPFRIKDLPVPWSGTHWAAGEFQTKAMQIVFRYVNAKLELTDTHVRLLPEDVYIVWFSKVLQNWKALISTTLPDGMYYELTYDGDRKTTYLDVYKKWENTAIPDIEEEKDG